MNVNGSSEWKTKNNVLMVGGVGVGALGGVVCSAQVACISCLVGLGEGFKRKVSMLTQIDSLTGDIQ